MAASGADAAAGQGAAPAASPWAPRERRYAEEIAALSIPSQPATAEAHPLAESAVREARRKARADEERRRAEEAAKRAKAPLSLSGQIDNPLGPSAGAGGSESKAGGATHEAGSSDGRSSNPYLNWGHLKADTLQHYTVGRSAVEVSSDLLKDGLDGTDESDIQPVGLEEARRRMEQLKTPTSTVEVTQETLVRHITGMHERLKREWAAGHRVVALRLAIRAAKMLGRIGSIPRFYPSICMLVTAMLDSFGSAVFRRLKAQADAVGGGRLPDNFTSTDVGAEARELTRSWFFKTSCIRELVPRLYIEIALLECYRFVADADFASILVRLAQSARGVGSPVVANFMRLYLAKMAARLVRGEREREVVSRCMSDMLFTFKDMTTARRLRALERVGLEQEPYLDLVSPPVAWLMHQLAWRAPSEEVFTSVLRRYKEQAPHPMVLRHVLEAFDGRHYSQHLPVIVSLIKAAFEKHPDSVTTKAEVFRSLCGGLVAVPPAPEQRKPLLQEAWHAVHLEEDSAKFAHAVTTLIALTSRYYSAQEVALLLGQLSKRMKAAAQAHAEEQAERRAEERAAAAAAAAAATAAQDDGGPTAGPSPFDSPAAGASPFEGPAAGAEVAGGSAGEQKEGEGAAERRFVLELPMACVPYVEAALVAVVGMGKHQVASGAEGGSQQSVVTSDAFMTLLDLLPEKRKGPTCKRILSAFLHQPESLGVLGVKDSVAAGRAASAADEEDAEEEVEVVTTTSDPMLVHTLLDVGRHLHDSLDLLSPADERRQVAELVAQFVARIDFGRDLQRTLSVLAEARQSFPSLDLVQDYVSQASLKAAWQALLLMRGRHNAKTAAFVRACLAFAHISIPALEARSRRMSLFQQAGQAALANGSVAQADAFLRAAVNEIAEMDPSDEPFLQSFAPTLMSTLLAAPAHPEQGAFHFLRGLLAVVSRQSFDEAGTTRPLIFIGAVRLLCAYGQEKFPYGLPTTQANDELYAGDLEYRRELAGLLKDCVGQVKDGVAALQRLASPPKADAGGSASAGDGGAPGHGHAPSVGPGRAPGRASGAATDMASSRAAWRASASLRLVLAEAVEAFVPLLSMKEAACARDVARVFLLAWRQAPEQRLAEHSGLTKARLRQLVRWVEERVAAADEEEEQGQEEEEGAGQEELTGEEALKRRVYKGQGAQYQLLLRAMQRIVTQPQG